VDAAARADRGITVRLVPGCAPSSHRARELFDLLAGEPGERFAGENIAKRLELEKGAHGVAGILA
jgi:hypothetical protein